MEELNITEQEIAEFSRLISDDLAGGEVDKITELFRYNKNLYAVVGNLVKDERFRVRVGVNILMDEMAEDKPEDAKAALPYLLPLLKDESPTIRGDGADLIGLIGDQEQIEDLRPLLSDPHIHVAEIVREAIECIKQKSHIFNR